jgi:mono/diheme cytochrome c family protein
VWKWLYFTPGPMAEGKQRSAQVDRGAYLVEALGHCGECHTPRNFLGAEKRSAPLGGGEAEGWHAPALNAASPAPVPWSRDALVNYLLDGWDEDHGVAGGPMTPVVNEFGDVSEDDATAIATYVLSFQDATNAKERGDAARAFATERAIGGTPLPPPGDTAEGRGQTIFTRVCANCHRSDSQTTTPLALLSSVNGPDPRNLIQTIDRGIKPPEASPDLTMPPFAGSLSEDQVADLAAFVRSRFSKQPAWTDLRARVAEVRKSTKPAK